MAIDTIFTLVNIIASVFMMMVVYNGYNNTQVKGMFTKQTVCRWREKNRLS